jgi:hypothetical protein
MKTLGESGPSGPSPLEHIPQIVNTYIMHSLFYVGAFFDGGLAHCGHQD